MFNETNLYKGNALRCVGGCLLLHARARRRRRCRHARPRPSPPPRSVLGAIVDPSMLGQLERYFKQMISDKENYVASAALTTSLLLMSRQGASDVIARWANEVNTVLTTRSDMVQFHALALLRAIKRHDRLAVSKVVQTLMRGGMRSPLGLCLLVRYAMSLNEADSSVVNQTVRRWALERC